MDAAVATLSTSDEPGASRMASDYSMNRALGCGDGWAFVGVALYDSMIF